MFSYYDSCSYSENASAIEKLDKANQDTYNAEIAHLRELEAQYIESDRNSYIDPVHLLHRLESVTTELAATQSRFEQEHNANLTANSFLGHSLLAVLGFFSALLSFVISPTFLKIYSPLVSILFSVALGLFLSGGCIFLGYSIMEHIYSSRPDFQYQISQSDRILLYLIVLLPSLVFILFSVWSVLR